MENGDIMGFNGTISRRGWWFYAVMLAITQLIAEAIFFADPENALGVSVGVIVFLIITYIRIAMNKARLNDAGWSGWWMLMPILNIVVMGFFRTEQKDK